MTSSLTVVRTGASTVNASLTRDTTISGHLTFSTTEVLCQTPIRDAGTFRYLYCMVSANGTSGSSTFKLRKSGADSAVGLTIAAGVTGGMVDSTNSESFADTDEASYRLVTGAGGSVTFRDVSIQFDPTNKADCISFLVARGLFSMTANSDNQFFIPNGYIDSLHTVESERKLRVRAAGTVRDMAVYVSSNARTSTTNFRPMLNGSPVGNNIQFAAGATGLVEDPTPEIAVAVGDDLYWRVTTGTGSGEAITTAFASCTFASTRHEFLMIAGHGTGTTINAGATSYFSMAGRLFGEGNEDQAELGFDGAQYCDFDFRVKDLNIWITVNTLDTTVDAIFLRKNRTSVPKIRITTSTVGLLEANSIWATFYGGGDTISYEVDCSSATAGSLSLLYISSVGCVHKAPPPPRAKRRVFQRSR